MVLRRALRGSCVLAVLALAGCALPRPALPPAEGVTAERLLSGLDARRQQYTSMRARARLKAGLAGLWTRQVVLVQRPGEVRMDVMSPFGLAMAVGTQNDVLWAYSPSNEARYEGEASPLNLSRFLGAPVSVSDLIDLLFGLPPQRTATAPPTLGRSSDGALLLSVAFDGGTQQLWFDPATLELRRAEERRGDAVALTAEFGDYQSGFPHSLEVAAPTAGSSAKLAYDAVEPNVPLDATLFAPPPAAHVLPLPAAPTPAQG